MIRGRFIEIIGLRTKYREEAQELFLMGLLSLLDAILKRALDDILEEVEAIDKIKEALINGEGDYGSLFKFNTPLRKRRMGEVYLRNGKI